MYLIIWKITKIFIQGQFRADNGQNCYNVSFSCLFTMAVTQYPFHTTCWHPDIMCVKFHPPSPSICRDIHRNVFLVIFSSSAFERSFLTVFLINYGISYIFRHGATYVPTLNVHISAMEQALSLL